MMPLTAVKWCMMFCSFWLRAGLSKFIFIPDMYKWKNCLSERQENIVQQIVQRGTYSLIVWSTCSTVKANNVNVDRTMAEGHQVRRQRSRSLAGALSRSADWTEELERRLRSREEDGGGCGGSGEYLEGYRGGGSQPLCATRRSSCGQISSCGFQDVFSGEYNVVSVLISVHDWHFLGARKQEIKCSTIAVVEPYDDRNNEVSKSATKSKH